MKLKQQEFKPIKRSNIIAIGGMIATGKTTLVEALAKKNKADILLELDENDDIQKSLLKGLYEKQNIAACVFQLYFFLKRFDNYKNFVSNHKNVIVDRTIFEDRLFAHQNMVSDPVVFGFYDNMWREKVNELIYSVGVPKLYVILKSDWDLFVERLFKRNRQIEIENFENNLLYFKNLNEVYVDFLEQTCLTYGIDFITIDANVPTEKKIEMINKKLKEIDEKL